MKAGARFIVKGTVQGVFFRQFVKDGADEFKLRGFCRNLESGDVEIVVEGEGDLFNVFKDKLKKGPAHSQIREVTEEEKNYSGDFKDFKVLRF